MFTIWCKYCHKEIQVSNKEQLYCNDLCQLKFNETSDFRKESICVICNKEFKHYGEAITCSKKCNSKYVSNFKLLETNPTEIQYCSVCNKKFRCKNKRSFCSLSCSHNIPMNQVEQENNICLLCGKISTEDLCLECTEKISEDKPFWDIVISGLQSSSKIVKKPWGMEIHIANSNNYCLKYLIFFKDKQFSFHVHALKTELWHCIYGKFECVLSKNNVKQGLVFNKGDKIELEAGVIHQLQAVENSILTEISTRDYPEDSIRLIEGIN